MSIVIELVKASSALGSSLLIPLTVVQSGVANPSTKPDKPIVNPSSHL
jgi:hypothetical protein